MIRTAVALGDGYIFVEDEEGRMFVMNHLTGGWRTLPDLPETDEQREERKLYERARDAGISV